MAHTHSALCRAVIGGERRSADILTTSLYKLSNKQLQLNFEDGSIIAQVHE
jgi:hypothetical protein